LQGDISSDDRQEASERIREVMISYKEAAGDEDDDDGDGGDDEWDE
jgi:hypothetical protein